MKINVDEKSLEKAFSSVPKKEERIENKKECKCSPGKDCECEKEEEVGFHKGTLNTLAAERNELIKMVGNVEMIMQAHLKRLEELGVKIEKQERK